ncbi:hypothetical protein HHK36_013038 [Tetracentron sinense]|uniref:Uncharacterized protein n=1 Tax=Tetracentron sinense TaxID=13715 RepID=A0A834ZA50_TETSI|nr:hypothetical protein HHK36_013038 [Tetracentron sinense]
MAESAVTFLLNRLVLLPSEEVQLLRGARREVEYIIDELQSNRGFLRDANAREESQESVKVWVEQVRDVAYEIEDVLDEFTLCLANPHQRRGFVGSLYKTVHFVKHLRLRHFPQGLDTMKDEELKKIVKEFLLQKRYVVIFDDMWSLQAWEAVKYALPDCNLGSRIMIMTRSADIASSCKEQYGYVYFATRHFQGTIVLPS